MNRAVGGRTVKTTRVRPIHTCGFAYSIRVTMFLSLLHCGHCTNPFYNLEPRAEQSRPPELSVAFAPQRMPAMQCFRVQEMQDLTFGSRAMKRR